MYIGYNVCLFVFHFAPPVGVFNIIIIIMLIILNNCEARKNEWRYREL